MISTTGRAVIEDDKRHLVSNKVPLQNFRMAGKETPMMQQYRSIKSELSSDTILFFRLGDFYEMFFEDAKITSEILGIALTQRNGTPMCGVPYHQLDPYLAKMIGSGQKVAICEQVEDANQTKGIVKREVTRVVTPGTILEEAVLSQTRTIFWLV